jgi:DNA-binding NarL/FixJ family response regulator
MKRDAKEIVPDARIAACRDPSRAERLAREKGCDVLLTNTVFDGSNWDGVMLAERIQRVNPRVNIIFITDHADTSAAYGAWQIGASAFLLRSYEKRRLAKALANPHFASE